MKVLKAIQKFIKLKINVDWKYECRKRRDKFNLWLARLLPKRLAYWAFIRVFAESGDNPDQLGFKGAADHWTQKYKIS